MAQLSTHLTLDVLINTIADLEVRVTELKRAANSLAGTYSLELPYPSVGTVTQPFRPQATSEVDAESGSDSQD